MANVRPKRAKNARVDDYFEEPPGTPVEEIPRQQPFFGSAYDNMHSNTFDGTRPLSGKGTSGIKSPKVGTLESLVSTLAGLHFTTKGKIDEDGKFELVFCSPEPVVTAVTPAEPPPVVRTRSRSEQRDRRRRQKTRFLL